MNFSNRNRQTLIVLLTAAFAVNLLDRHILNITLNDIGNEFNLSDLQLGSLSGFAFAVIFVLIGFPAAKLSRQGNRKKMVLGAITIWSVMTAVTGTASNFVQLILCRIGVGVGEGGFMPPAHAMIAASYPPEKRGAALALFSSGANIGLFLSFLVGGIIASLYGWRTAFFVAAIPGLIIAILLFLFLREPMVDQSAKNDQSDKLKSPKFRPVLKILMSNPSSKHAIIGAVLTAIVGAGAVTWIATFLARSHGLSPAQAGIYFALTVGIGGAFMSYFIGVLSDRLGLKSPQWRLKLIAIVILIAKPFAIAFYLLDHTVLALSLFVIPAVLGSVFTGPTFAHLYSRVEPEQRPLVTAIMMFLFNLIGLGLGPVIVGAISDGLASSVGDDSLRYALVTIQIAGIWGAIHYWIAGRNTDH